MVNENMEVKKGRKGLIIGISIAVAVIAIAIVAGILIFNSTSSVADINGMKVSKAEYTYYLEAAKQQFLQENGKQPTDTIDWENTTVNTTGETAAETVRKLALEMIQETKIQLSQAEAAGIKMEKADEEEVDAFIDYLSQQYGSKSEADKQIKAAYGITLNDFKDIYAQRYLANKYLKAELEKVTISDDDAKKYYDENKANYDKVTVVHVLIKTVDDNNQPLSEGKKKEAKAKADDILLKVKAGEDIRALAEKNSEDPGVTTNKGEYTFTKTDSYLEEFKDLAFKLKVGESGIAETSVGYHVMKVEKKEEQSFDDVKDSIKSSLQNLKFNTDFSVKMEEWKKDTKYSINKKDKNIQSIELK